jgi:hypothetical protein
LRQWSEDKESEALGRKRAKVAFYHKICKFQSVGLIAPDDQRFSNRSLPLK